MEVNLGSRTGTGTERKRRGRRTGAGRRTVVSLLDTKEEKIQRSRSTAGDLTHCTTATSKNLEKKTKTKKNGARAELPLHPPTSPLIRGATNARPGRAPHSAARPLWLGRWAGSGWLGGRTSAHTPCVSVYGKGTDRSTPSSLRGVCAAVSTNTDHNIYRACL